MHSTFGFGTLLLAATSLSVFVSVDGKAAPLEKPVVCKQNTACDVRQNYFFQRVVPIGFDNIVVDENFVARNYSGQPAPANGPIGFNDSNEKPQDTGEPKPRTISPITRDTRSVRPTAVETIDVDKEAIRKHWFSYLAGLKTKAPIVLTYGPTDAGYCYGEIFHHGTVYTADALSLTDFNPTKKSDGSVDVAASISKLMLSGFPDTALCFGTVSDTPPVDLTSQDLASLRDTMLLVSGLYPLKCWSKNPEPAAAAPGGPGAAAPDPASKPEPVTAVSQTGEKEACVFLRAKTGSAELPMDCTEKDGVEQCTLKFDLPKPSKP
ncbi:MAG: hypothetical protein IKE66_10720 [Hyphomicrobium sp.]|nr:hypothetical protein [Hyphomicrobium sp.]